MRRPLLVGSAWPVSSFELSQQPLRFLLRQSGDERDHGQAHHCCTLDGHAAEARTQFLSLASFRRATLKGFFPRISSDPDQRWLTRQVLSHVRLSALMTRGFLLSREILSSVGFNRASNG